MRRWGWCGTSEPPFYRLQAQAQVVSLQEQLATAAAATADFAERLRAAGNINDVDFATQMADGAQTQVDLLRARGERAADREAVKPIAGPERPGGRAVDGV